VISTDWVPTWLELAGVKPTEPLDGVSLLPVLTGGELAERNLYWHFPHYSNQGGRPAGAIRSGDWKLIEHFEDGRTELFNLGADPGEGTDLAAREPDRAADLHGQLAAWREAVGAQENAPNQRFDPELARELYRDVDVSRLAATATAADTRVLLASWRGTMNAVVKRNLISTDARPVMILAAREAQIHGDTLRYEAAAHRDALTGWTKVEDWPSWEVTVETPGEYAVELLYGCGKGGGGTEVAVQIGDATVKATVAETGSFEHFVPQVIGRVKLAAGPAQVAVKVVKKAGGAAMSLRHVVLVPWAPAPARAETSATR
jgi:hypothetical protein